MTKSPIIIGLGAAVILQTFVLSGMFVKAAMPLWIGTEIRVNTLPVDPRSMFRGNYAKLDYDFSQLPPETVLIDTPRLRRGEVIYVSLKKNEDGIYQLAQASLSEPDGGVFLRGRIDQNRPPFRVKYGIEAFFAPKEKALRLEKNLQNGAVAILMVTDTGRVALREIVLNTNF